MHNIVPLYKSCRSIGKSLLRPKDILELSEGDPEVFIVEDEFSGFPEFLNLFGERLRFGLRLPVYDLFHDESHDPHKVVVWASGDNGYRSLIKLYREKLTSMDMVYEIAGDDCLVCIPFYDSFLAKNLMSFSSYAPTLKKDTFFFIENNNLPYDEHVSSQVTSFCKNHGHEIIRAKTILYRDKGDVEALQTYKCICNRKIGRETSLSKPQLDGFGSDEFCYESWKEQR
jgi:DNA polymerase III alpha subunit